MGFFEKLSNIATGGLVTEVVDLVKTYLPPEMSPEKKAELTLNLENIALTREKNLEAAIAQSEALINERIREYEGTAKDLQSVPILGPLMIFLRGAQRPVIGYATIYLDFMVFSGKWNLSTDPQLSSAFWVINVLVFGFLFGERAVRNVMPVILDVMGKKKLG